MWIRLQTTLGTVPEMGGGCHHLSLSSTMCHRNHFFFLFCLHFHFGSAFWYAISLPPFPSSPLRETRLMLTNLCYLLPGKGREVEGVLTNPCEARQSWHHPNGHALYLLLVDAKGRLIPHSDEDTELNCGQLRDLQRRSVQDRWVSSDMLLHS